MAPLHAKRTVCLKSPQFTVLGIKSPQCSDLHRGWSRCWDLREPSFKHCAVLESCGLWALSWSLHSSLPPWADGWICTWNTRQKLGKISQRYKVMQRTQIWMKSKNNIWSKKWFFFFLLNGGLDQSVTGTLAARNTHPTALLSSCLILSLEEPSKISALVFPRSSIIILSDCFLHALSSLTVDQKTCKQLRVVSPAWSDIIITRMTEPVGSHEVQQTSPNSLEHTHEPNTNSCFFLKAELSFAPPLPVPKQSGQVTAKLLNTS